MFSRNFRLQKVGGFRWLRENYNFFHVAFSIDELIVLDVTRGERDEDKFHECIQFLTEECFIPIAAGGGIRTLEQARSLLNFGADKIVVNTLLAQDSNIIAEIAKEFGQQSLVASIDVKLKDKIPTVWNNNGSVEWKMNFSKVLSNIENLPIGELYLNSMDRDGTGFGYQTEMLDFIPNQFSVPVILAGGAGKYTHFSDALQDERVDAVATANLFNFIGDGLEVARLNLLCDGYNLAEWNVELISSLRNICAD